MNLHVCWTRPLKKLLPMMVALIEAVIAQSGFAAQQPALTSIFSQNNNLVISATVPAGYRYAVLEAADQVMQSQREPLVAGGMDGSMVIVTFRIPISANAKFLCVRVGPEATIPSSTF